SKRACCAVVVPSARLSFGTRIGAERGGKTLEPTAGALGAVTSPLAGFVDVAIKATTGDIIRRLLTLPIWSNSIFRRNARRVALIGPDVAGPWPWGSHGFPLIDRRRRCASTTAARCFDDLPAAAIRGCGSATIYVDLTPTALDEKSKRHCEQGAYVIGHGSRIN